MLSCKEIRTLLGEGRKALRASQEAAVSAHVASCSRCDAVVRRFQRASGHLVAEAAMRTGTVTELVDRCAGPEWKPDNVLHERVLRCAKGR